MSQIEPLNNTIHHLNHREKQGPFIGPRKASQHHAPHTNNRLTGTKQCVSTGTIHQQVEVVAQEVCPQCHGDRWLRCSLPPWHPQYTSLVACNCLLRERRPKRREQLHALSGLPIQHSIPTLDSFSLHVRGVQQGFCMATDFIKRTQDIQTVTHEAQRLDILSQRGWIVFRGPVGVGKTHLAMAVSVAA